MSVSHENIIVLEVLKVASKNVLGETEPLRVSAPCSFSNAKGNLREAKDLDHIKEIAQKSASDFLKAFCTE